MTLKPYLYIAKMRVLSALAYRFDVLSTILIQCIVMVATSFFWSAAYGTREIAIGTTKEQMLTYIIMSSVLSCLFKIGVENNVQANVRDGKIAVDMIKPVNLFGMYFATDVGGTVISLFLNVIPLLIISSIFIHIPAPASFMHFILFVLCVIISYLINWIFCACFSMIAFWTVSIGPMLHIKYILVRILSGSLIPLWFFPEVFQGVLKFLPFMYMYQLPLSIYIGRATSTEIISQMSIQCVWLVVLFAIYKLLYFRIEKNVLVQGG